MRSKLYSAALVCLSLLTSCSGKQFVNRPEKFLIGGTLSGLNPGGQLTVSDNGGDSLTLSQNGPFQFDLPVDSNGSYLVAVVTQPTGETCTIANYSGAGTTANVFNVNVTCSVDTYPIGGSISGLAAGAQVVLENNGADLLTVGANGNFTFADPVAYQGSYNVTVGTQPIGQTCTVSNGAETSVIGPVTNINVLCATDTFTIGGNIVGLASGDQVTLINNGADPDIVTANGSFTFDTPVAYNGTYNVTVGTQPVGQTCTVMNGTGIATAINITNIAVTCSTDTYTIGGSVSGLTSGTQLVLDNNGGDALTLNANGTFTFVMPVSYGGSFDVTVGSQPVGQTCTVSRGMGSLVTSNITNVSVLCATDTFPISGSIAGLTANGLVLKDNGGDALSIPANGSTFQFAVPVSYGSGYNVTVFQQPIGQTCTLGNTSGTNVTAPVNNVTVACTTSEYTVGVTMSGLSGSVVLQDNGGDNLTVSSNGNFPFVTSLTYGASYNVTVQTQPATQTCTVSSGTGTATSNVTVSVSCSTNSYTVGGSVTGLSGTVVLQDNGGDSLMLNSSGGFTFPTSVAEGSLYSVTIKSQPATQVCTVANGSGTMGGANVTNVHVTCTTNTYTVGGTVTNLSGTVTLLDNGGNATPISGNGNFTFTTAVAEGSTYAVTVGTQPSTQTCTVTSGSGTMSGANVTNVSVTCSTNKYTVGGTLSGLSGTVVLQDDAGNNTTINTNGPFTFSTSVAEGSAYAVTVLTQPSTQTCTVASGSGTMGGANITNVIITCTTNTYTVTPTGDIHETISPGTAQTVNYGTTKSFTVIANAGYSVSSAVGGTCPVGSWSGNTYTTGAITANCTLIFSATIEAFMVTPSGDGNETISPSAAQTVNYSTTISFAVTANVGYSVSSAVGGTCPVGTWSGGIYTTGAITANCTVNFSATPDATTLTASVSTLALSVDAPTQNAALTGNPRTITIANTGSYTATNLAIATPTWPTGTTSSTTCESSLAAGGTCTITVTPGASATSACGVGTGSAPTPGIVSVSASNVLSSTATSVVVLTYQCIYQQGYVFAIDDTTLNTSSIGGKIASLANVSPGATWFNGASITTNAQSLTDGAANTAMILAVQGAGSYAASVAANYTIDSVGNTPCSSGTCYTKWYLPAICELGDSSICSSNTPSLGNNLTGLSSAQCTETSCLSGIYWSSTEYSGNPSLGVYADQFIPGGPPLASILTKGSSVFVRAVRALSGSSPVPTYTVGGTVSGLTGTVTLQDNNGDNLILNSDGVFNFTTPITQGQPYNVTVLTQPATQTCTITNGSGTMGGANVTNVTMSCVNSYTLGGTVTGLLPGNIAG